MVERHTGSVEEWLSYDPENHLTGLSGGPTTATFAYNGDGQRVWASINGVTTRYAGLIEYELGSGGFASTNILTQYYDAGGQRVALRRGATVHYLLSDHLGSTSVTLKSDGSVWSEQRYSAWGETRFSSGSFSTDRQFTGQVTMARPACMVTLRDRGEC